MGDYRAGNDLLMAQSSKQAARAVGLYRGILEYGRSRVTPAGWTALLYRMDAVGLPLPTNLNSIRAITDFKVPRALLDLVYGMSTEIDSTSVGNYWLDIDQLTVTGGGLQVPGELDSIDNDTDQSISGNSEFGATTVGAALTCDDLVVDVGQVTAKRLVSTGQSSDVGGVKVISRMEGPHLRLSKTYSKQNKLPDAGALFADKNDTLWHSRVGGGTQGVGAPTVDTGWFGVQSHIYLPHDLTPLRITIDPPSEFRLPAIVPGESGGIVDIQVLLRGLAIWPDGRLVDGPYTFRDGELGHPWYSAGPCWSSGVSGYTAGVTVAIDNEGYVHLVLGTGTVWQSKTFESYAELRILAWMRGGY